MKISLCILAAACLFSGCASMKTVEQRFESVNYTDGIDSAEAKSIAQKFIMQHPDVNQYVVSMPQLDTWPPSFPEWKDQAWVVGFSAKPLNFLSHFAGRMFVVAIDRSSGNILFYKNGHANGAVPFQMRSYGDGGLEFRG